VLILDIKKKYNKYNICIEGFKHYLLGSINNLGSELVLISSISRLVMELILANELIKCGRM
jgi:hypothetical protein